MAHLTDIEIPLVDSDHYRSCDTGAEQENKTHGRICLALYTSYALATWARRGMEFMIAIILIELYPDSLVLVSLYGLLDNGVRVTLGSAMGGYIDRAERWTGARNCYLIQNVCISGAGLTMGVVLSGMIGQPGRPEDPGKWRYWALVSASLFLSALSGIGNTGITIAVEKNMPKQICGDDSVKLSTMNSVFRAIDLVCLLASPILSGFLMTFISPLVAVLVLAGYCLVAWVPELMLLRWACSTSSQLSASKNPPSLSSLKPDGKEDRLRSNNGWVIYGRQSVLLVNLSLALLYMTVLSLGFLMTSYLKWSGLTEAEVSIYRGIGSITGLLSTVTFPILRRKIGLVNCGFIGISMQFISLALGVIPTVLFTLGWHLPDLGSQLFWGVGTKPSLEMTRLLIGSVVASRFGLWLFDLAVTQLVQERVKPHELGAVYGVQISIQSCFETSSFLAGVFLPSPEEFWVLLGGSLCVVGCALLLYVAFMMAQGTPYTSLEQGLIQEHANLKSLVENR